MKKEKTEKVSQKFRVAISHTDELDLKKGLDLEKEIKITFADYDANRQAYIFDEPIKKLTVYDLLELCQH